jgi:protein gp37
MSEHTKIEWTNHSWPVVSGCHKRSPGCANCWAVPTSWKLSHNPAIQQSYRGTVEKVIRDESGQRLQVQAGQPGRLQWTGQINMLEVRLNWPQTRKWKPGSKIFVSDMADLCSLEVTDEFILKVFQAMLDAPQYTYQILTKDPHRLVALQLQIGRLVEEYGGSALAWPGNWWFGTSVENPAWYKRILDLIRLPASVHYISAEPLLKALKDIPLEHIEWVIAGCESGPRARPMDERWVEQLKIDTKAAGAAFFYKQRLDEKGHKVSLPMLQGRQWAEFPSAVA